MQTTLGQRQKGLVVRKVRKIPNKEGRKEESIHLLRRKRDYTKGGSTTEKHYWKERGKQRDGPKKATGN